MKTYDIHEAAEFLKIDRTTALELAGSSELPGAKVGRSWVFLESDLIEYLRDRVRQQTNERRALVRTQALAIPGHPAEGPPRRRRRRPPPSLDDVTVPASPPAPPAPPVPQALGMGEQGAIRFEVAKWSGLTPGLRARSTPAPMKRTDGFASAMAEFPGCSRTCRGSRRTSTAARPLSKTADRQNAETPLE